MTYASDLGLKVGSKIRVIDPSKEYGSYNDGDILELKRDDRSRCPVFLNITTGDDSCCFTIQDRSDGVTWEHYKEEEKDMTSAIKIKFPCCVPMSEIKDQETFDKIFALFLANGAEKYEADWEDNKDCGYNYFGVDYDKDTLFYGCVESYSFNDEEDEVTVYSVAELLGLVPKEETPVTAWVATAPVISLLPVGTEVQIAKDSEYYVESDRNNPINIKGVLLRNTPAYPVDDYPYQVKWSNGATNSYKLNDLVLWNEGWIQWNGVGTPTIKGGVCELKFRDGSTDIDDDFTVSSWRWDHYNERDIVAYRLHTPVTTSIASQEAITERLEDKPSVSIDLSKDASGEPVYPNVGDKIKIIGNERYHRFAIGEIVTVVENCSDEDTPNWRCSNKEDLSHVCGGWVYVGEFELVKEVEAEPYEYKVGDLVEITACKYDHKFNIGEVVRLTSKGYGGDWEAEHLDKRDYWYIHDSEYKLSSSVVAQSEVKETPLVSIVKDVTYHVNIKGTLFTFTQDEINELTEELLGFSDDLQ